VSATGGITLQNVAAHAACGVDLLVTSHPYHAPPADIKARMRVCADEQTGQIDTHRASSVLCVHNGFRA